MSADHLEPMSGDRRISPHTSSARRVPSPGPEQVSMKTVAGMNIVGASGCCLAVEDRDASVM